MTDAKTLALGTGRMPRQVLWVVVAVCVAPWLLNALGVDFGVAPYRGPALGDLEGLELTDALHHALAGSFVHTLLEWTAFALAIFTVMFAFLHFSAHRDVALPIIGLALFLAGSVDAFHTLAATRLIPAVADNARFIPFTWAISRTFHAVIVIVGMTIFLLGGKRAFQFSPRFLLVTSAAFVLFAYLTIQITAASPQLPVTEFPDSIVKRPYDVPALILFLIAGVFVCPRFLAQHRSVFAHALMIGMIPEVTTQLHMVFWSQSLFDNSFNIAHFLKIVAHSVPLAGLALDYYVRPHMEFREGERRYQTLIHGTHDLIQSVDRHGNLLFVNPAWREKLEYSAHEIDGMNVTQIIPTDDWPHCEAVLERVLSGETVEGIRTGFRAKSGRVIQVEGVVIPGVSGGQVVATHGFFRDITAQLAEHLNRQERIRILEMQQASVLQLITSSAVIEGAFKRTAKLVNELAALHVAVERASVWVLAAGGAQLKCVDLFERTPRKHSQVEALAAVDYPRYFTALQKERAVEASDARSDPRTSEFTEGYLIPLGITSMLDVAVRVEGNVIGVLCLEHTGTRRKWQAEEIRFVNTLADTVTSVVLTRNRRRAERKAEQMAAELQQLIDTANAPIFGIDTLGRVNEWNNMAAAICGYAKDEVMGQQFVATLITPEYRESVNEVLGRALAGEETANYELLLRTKAGDQVVVLLNATPRWDLNGNIIGVVGVGQDITDRKRAEEELEQERAELARRVTERTADLSVANAELGRTARAKDEFLANMSHELRTPLNAILATSESLQEAVYGELNEQQVHPVQLIEESGRHLLALINDILDLSKVEAGKLDLMMESVAIEDIAQASLRFIKEPAQKKRLKVETAFDAQVQTVWADARRLKQILVNLLSNAVKFTPEGGTVGLEVTGDPAGEVFRLAVWDTGVGIAAERQQQLFKPFVQLDAGLDREYEGTGLGLALVARMTELHGGSVTVESAGEGQGSRFTVSLPWDPATVPAEVGEPARQTPVSAQRVLIVDDSPTTAHQLVRYLAEHEVQTIVHPVGEGVVEQVVEQKADVILLDLILPDKSGWEVLAELKADERTRDVAVVIVSVMDERAKALAAGAADYIVKPVTRKRLEEVCDGLCFSQLAQALVVGGKEPVRSGAGPLILLAEDNETNITAMCDYLVAKGYRMVVARNGGEAVDRTREIRPDLILMDIQMPGMDGLEATHQIREDPEFAGTPIIALTALAMAGDRERCLAAGANEYFSKPVSLRKLNVTIRQLLGREAD